MNVLAERLNELGKQSDEETVATEMNNLDLQFHQRILDIADNIMIQQVAHRYHILHAVWAHNDRGVPAVHKEHLAIIKAIEENRPDDAEHIIRDHIRAGKRGLERCLKSGSYQFDWARPEREAAIA